MSWPPRLKIWAWATEVNRFTVLYDACVLYPAPLRHLLLRLALTDLYRARWSDAIHEEWIRAVLRNRPDLSRQQLERTRALMNAHVRDKLPDPEDSHVLAAAIQCGADLILTFNLNDFPEPVLATHGISACHPDRFLVDQLTLAPDRVCTAIQQHRASLKNPPKTVEEYLKTMKLQGLPTFSQTVLDYSSAL